MRMKVKSYRVSGSLRMPKSEGVPLMEIVRSYNVSHMLLSRPLLIGIGVMPTTEAAAQGTTEDRQACTPGLGDV
jgi:hypothetical protein